MSNEREHEFKMPKKASERPYGRSGRRYDAW